MLLAVRLPRGSLYKVVIFVQLPEDVLCDIFLLLRRCPAKDIETYLKPLVYVCVYLIVFVT